MVDRPTVCGFCSCGCALYVEPRNGRIGALRPSENHPVSSSRLCFKGWSATPALRGPERLTTPLVRKGDRLEPASWEEAVAAVGSAIKHAGPDSVGVIGSAKTTNEECYALVKLARGVIGTPNIDSSCRFYDASLIPALLETTGVPASQIELNELREARSMLAVGANVMDQLAHVATRIEDAVAEGCKLVAVDPRASRLKVHTSLLLQPKPGTDLVWVRALLKTIIDRNLFAEHAAQLPGFEELHNSLADVQLGRLPDACGLDAAQIAEVAQTLAANAPTVVMFGLGVLQQHNSTALVRALADVALLLGGSVLPLRGQNNAQGASDMGLLRDYLPGYGKLTDAAARGKWKAVWDREPASAPGLSAVDMVRSCESGQLKALLIFGENLALSAPNTEAALSALDRVGFLAVADLYLTETARLADVVFPAASYLEKDGTFTNIERRVQRVRKVFDPPGESKTDLEIISLIASALGGKIAGEPAKAMAEISANVPQYSGVAYAALDESWGEQWPSNGVSARLAAVPGAEVPTEADYPFRLIASRINFHQQTGTMASRTGVLAREYPETFVELNESDAEKRGLRAGSPIRITSASGSMIRRLALSDGVPAGCVHVPHFFGGDSPNTLSSYECDPVSGVPVYKGIAVKVEAAK